MMSRQFFKFTPKEQTEIVANTILTYKEVHAMRKSNRKAELKENLERALCALFQLPVDSINIRKKIRKITTIEETLEIVKYLYELHTEYYKELERIEKEKERQNKVIDFKSYLLERQGGIVQ